jgi:hypothetical protein
MIAVLGNEPDFLKKVFNLQKKKEGKAHPLQAMQTQRFLGELRLLDFLTSALYGGRLSASIPGPSD